MLRKIGTTRVAGALIALGAAWLFPQRSDPGSRLILAVLLAAGIGLLALRTDAPHRALRRIAATVLVVAVLGFGAYGGAETPTAHWFGGGITHGPTRSSAVALTFDDGPNVSATLRIMKILDDAHVKGTFFE
ncbi:MAG: Polysaccharide deacetylase, partial [Actinomycetota bacterium]|nr:Polysaccharide deacetylase [Actinomycetota bacterium]